MWNTLNLPLVFMNIFIHIVKPMHWILRFLATHLTQLYPFYTLLLLSFRNVLSTPIEGYWCTATSSCWGKGTTDLQVWYGRRYFVLSEMVQRRLRILPICSKWSTQAAGVSSRRNTCWCKYYHDIKDGVFHDFWEHLKHLCGWKIF